MRERLMVLVAGCLLMAACGSKAPEQSKTAAPAPASSAQGGAAAPGQAPAAATPPAEAAPAVVTHPPPPPPPQPKVYTISAGTPISVTTMDAVDTKHTKTENEFEGTLASPIAVDGHTLAKPGATVIGVVTNADQGGRAKGKASLTLTLSRVLLASGSYLKIRTNTVTQVAKSGTKKNVTRTGLMAGGGAVIGAIAGGGKGAAIGAGIGAGAGVATNLATRGPAAEIPAGSVLNFSTTQTATVTVKP